MSATTSTTDSPVTPSPHWIEPVATVVSIAVTALALGLILTPVAMPTSLGVIALMIAATGPFSSIALMGLTISSITGSSISTQRFLAILAGVFLAISLVALIILFAPITLPTAVSTILVSVVFTGSVSSLMLGIMSVKYAVKAGGC